MIEKIISDSSNIKKISYDEPSSILYVEFIMGGIYKYSDVPSSIFQGMIAAPSKGKYFSANIRGKFPVQKVGTKSI